MLAQTDTPKDTHTDIQSDRHADRQRGRLEVRHSCVGTDRQKGRHVRLDDRHTYSVHTYRQDQTHVPAVTCTGVTTCVSLVTGLHGKHTVTNTRTRRHTHIHTHPAFLFPAISQSNTLSLIAAA